MKALIIHIETISTCDSIEFLTLSPALTDKQPTLGNCVFQEKQTTRVFIDF